MDWSDHAMWWPERNIWLDKTRFIFFLPRYGLAYPAANGLAYPAENSVTYSAEMV